MSHTTATSINDDLAAEDRSSEQANLMDTPKLEKDGMGNGKVASFDMEEPSIQQDIGFTSQFCQYTRQAFSAYRCRFFTPSRLVNGFGYIIVFTVAWFQIPSTEYNLICRKLSLYLLLVHPAFDVMNEVATCRFFWLDEITGKYSISNRLAYFLARVTSESTLLVLFFFPQFCAIYWLLGYAPSASAFCINQSILLFSALGSQGLGRCLGLNPLKISIGDIVAIANLSMIYITVFAGFALFSNPPIQNLIYTSFHFYAFSGLLQAEFIVGNAAIECASVENTMFTSCTSNTTTVVPANDAIGTLKPMAPLWVNITVLVAFFIIINFIAFLFLLTQTRKSKRKDES